MPRHPSECELQRLSPEEEHHALILATARDIRRGLNIDEWAAVWVSMPVSFRVILEKPNLTAVGITDGHLFFAASQLREKIGEDFEAMYYTTVTCRTFFITCFKISIKEIIIPVFLVV